MIFFHLEILTLITSIYNFFYDIFSTYYDFLLPFLDFLYLYYDLFIFYLKYYDFNVLQFTMLFSSKHTILALSFLRDIIIFFFPPSNPLLQPGSVCNAKGRPD